MEKLRDLDIENLDKVFESLNLNTHNVKMGIIETLDSGQRRRFGERYRRRYESPDI